jgi:hypothetical protein
MKLKKIIKRIEYLKTEITHGGFWDGWALTGMKKELKELEENLKNDE